jgi:DNA/RNA-binding domain of Phe-tRNA-synthetase-like protein
MSALPFRVRLELDGWRLFWALLDLQSADPRLLSEISQQVAQQVRTHLSIDTLSANPTVAALRRLFHAAGCDPTRYRPSSEALLRRLLKGEDLPRINQLVDLNNCLSASLAVPCCVMDEDSLDPPFLFRAGREGESYESLRGPFNLAGKPLLLDASGPCDAPITGGQRVKVTAETGRAWLVAYLPSGVVETEAAEQRLSELLAAAAVAHVCLTGAA